MSGICFAQATPQQIMQAAELSYRIYKDAAIRRAFASPEMVLGRWRWIMEGNPIAAPFGLPAWVATRGDDVVGHFGLIPATAMVHGRHVRVAWGRDFFVDPSVRGMGVGSGLVETAVRSAGAVLVAGLNAQATRAYRRVGFVERGPIPFYVKVLQPAEFAAQIAGKRLRPSAARILSAGAALWGRRRRSDPSAAVRVVQSFDTRFDDWWSSVEPRRGCVMRRTSATMNWRYRQHPSHSYMVLELERGGRLRGIAVMRTGVSRDLPAGLIVEILVEPRDWRAAHELTSAAERYLAADPSSPVFLRSHTSGPEMGIALLMAGFVPSPSPFTWMIADPHRVGPGHGSPFFLNGGDSDLDFI